MTAVEEFGDLTPPAASLALLQPGSHGPHWVYFHLDSAGRPLYVGCTTYPDQRVSQHRRNASWFGLINEIRYLGPFDEFVGARVEADLIAEYEPPYNIAGTGRGRKQMNIPFPPAQEQATARGGAA